MPEHGEHRFKAVLFDLDGTLVDTAPEAAEALNRTLSPHGVAPVQPDAVRHWFGRGMLALLDEALAALAGGCVLPPRETLQQEFAHHYRELSGQLSTLYPAAQEVLRVLQQRGVHCALLTNKEQGCARRVIDAHGLAGLFDVYIFGDTYPRRKPDPQGVNACLQRWSLAPEQALFVGDSEIDAATARNAGISVWLASYGYMRGGAVQDAGADRVFDSLEELRMIGA